MYQVIGTARSRSMRVFWMLEELGQEYEIIESGPRSKAIAEVNPSGKVPALIVDGKALLDSVAIMQLIDKKKILSNSMKIVYDKLDDELGSNTMELNNSVEDVVSLNYLKKEYAQRILIKFEGNIKIAANAIGITPRTMKSLAYPAVIA